jgi:hypothetical protein
MQQRAFLSKEEAKRNAELKEQGKKPEKGKVKVDLEKAIEAFQGQFKPE